MQTVGFVYDISDYQLHGITLTQHAIEICCMRIVAEFPIQMVGMAKATIERCYGIRMQFVG